MITLTVRGVELAVDELGGDPSPSGSGVGPGAGSGDDATPFVWGHGLTSSMAAEDERPLVDLAVLAADRHVVRYDARGHGRSGPLTEARLGAWAELAQDQIALIDQLGLDRVALGGASMGTATALHTAVALGDRVRALVLVIPPTAWESRAAQIGLYEQMAAVVEAQGVAPLIAGQQQNPPPDPFRDDADEYDDRAAQRLRTIDPQRLAMVFRGAGHADLPPRTAIASLVQPTLVLAWSGDSGHPETTATQLGELMPNAEVVVASTADQLGTWTDRTRTFLRDHR